VCVLCIREKIHVLWLLFNTAAWNLNVHKICRYLYIVFSYTSVVTNLLVLSVSK